MINGNFNNDLRPKVDPKRRLLSLGLHTMPQTGSSHFKKWLLLGLLVFGLLVLVGLIIFW